MRKTLVALSVLAATALPAVVNAADYSDDIHKNDYKWSQFNLMYSFDELPGESDHDYLEMEFGGRSGIFDLYGYVDVFNLTSDKDSDKAGKEKIFMKFAPRVSLDALTGKDLSFGPVQELYLATLMEWGGNSGVNNQKIGLGSDVMVPWLGKIGLNLMASYRGNDHEWNGYHLATNWFKPFHFFDNGSFLSYQGYIDYEFGVDKSFVPEEFGGAQINTTSGGAMFNGLYWHSDRYAVGYGLKLYNEVYALKDDGAAGKTSGVSHYVSVTYKF